jgi:hypothetical protein
MNFIAEVVGVALYVKITVLADHGNLVKSANVHEPTHILHTFSV